jgi:trimethylamine:corrinoid methyltransferase-like protein
MIQSSSAENQSVFFRVLSDDQAWEIRQAVVDVLEKADCNALHEGVSKLLQRAGAVVTHATKLILYFGYSPRGVER